MVQKLFTLIIFFSSINLHADVLFEGYSKVRAGGVHVGYFIGRYEFNPRKKEFTATTFLKTNELGGNITESLKASAKEDLSPISYSYTTLIGNTAKTIDAKFNGLKMNAVIKDGDKVSKVNRDLPKGSFLSAFLTYVILKSPKGMSVDTKYDYQAIAEEDALLQKGMAFIKGTEDINGIKGYRIINEFKGQKFISLVTERGEVISTKSPVQSIGTELMSQSSLATNGFQLPTSLLKQLFGDVPLGISNEVSKKYQNTKTPSVAEQVPPANQDTTQSAPQTGKFAPAGKQSGVPAGKGLMLKGQTNPSKATDQENEMNPSQTKSNPVEQPNSKSEK